jgi:hypothetical protein
LLHALEGETVTQLLFLSNAVMYKLEYDVMMFNAYNLTTIVQDWSFSDLMFATKKNLANAVATVSKQLENVHETLAVSSFYWLSTSLFFLLFGHLFSLSVDDLF